MARTAATEIRAPQPHLPLVRARCRGVLALALAACCALLGVPAAAQDAPRPGSDADTGRSTRHESRHQARRGPVERRVDRMVRHLTGRGARAGAPGRALRVETRRDERRQLADELGVTQTQRDLLHATRDQHREALGQARDDTRAAREALHAAALSQPEPADAAALQAASQRLADALKLQADRREALRAEARRILTPQQSGALQAERDARRELRSERKSLRHDVRALLRDRHQQRQGSPEPR